MPEYTIVRSDNGHVVLRTTELADLPDKRILKAMRMSGAVLYEDGEEVTDQQYSDLVSAIQDEQDREYAKRKSP